LIRIIVYFIVTNAGSFVCWGYGIIFSAVFKNFAGDWFVISFVAVLVMLVLQLIGICLKAMFWSFAISTKNM
jgi:hypothetical protein